MTSSSLTPANLAAPPTKDSFRRRVVRALFGTRTRRMGTFVIVAILGSGLLWFNQHRRMGWREAVSPAYWLARSRGEDLYDPAKGLLMHGNRQIREVALTFDDGPHVESRGQILDTLKQYGARATFFDVGEHLIAQPELVKRTLAEGHEIANHSNTHLRLDGLSARDRHREINDAAIAFYRVAHQHLTLLRPPGMRVNDAVFADCRDLGYIVVGYNTVARDADPETEPDFIVQRTCDRVENGSILLLHDYPATAKALSEILKRLKSEGYHFVTVTEMIDHLPPLPHQQVLDFQQSRH